MNYLIDENEVSKHFPHLFSKEPVPSLKELLKDYRDIIPKTDISTLDEILKKNKDSLLVNEKKFLEWIRFSIAYKIQKYSPVIINQQWSEETHKILKKVWDKYFTENDPCGIGSMGKLGSNELNLSSDIDLIFFSEDISLQSKIRDFIKDCSTPGQNPPGYIIDLDLRPEGKAAPILISPERLGYHLWNNSDPWERYSYTRLQIRIGNKSVKDKTLSLRDKFCYRKYLTSDFFPKFLELRPKYHRSVKNVDNHLKLSPGGIRDLELLVQTFQILHGGRDIELQSLSTLDAIEKLKERDSFRSSEFFNNLKLSYLVLRNEEGLLHAFNPKGSFLFDSQDKSKSSLIKAMDTIKESIAEYSSHWDAQFKSTNTKPLPGKLREELKAYAKKNDYSIESAENNFKSFFKEKSFSQYVSAISNQVKLKNIFFDLLCISPFGCQILARRPSLLDLFIMRVESKSLKTLPELISHLSDLKMVQHILASLYFSKNENLEELSLNLGQSYKNIISQIFDHLGCKDKIDLLLLGKAAGNELGLKSDIDFIIINKTLENQSLLCRDIFKLLSSSSAFGPLVPFDNRGGPQGSASPLAVKKNSLVKFINDEAEPWQRLMYLKNKLLFEDQKIDFKSKALTKKDQESLDLILSKRLKVSDPNAIFFKTAPGGLFHIEFTFSNLFLKLEKNPKTAHLKLWCEELSLYYPENTKEITTLYKNFLILRHIEQKWCISGYKKSPSHDLSTERVQSILKENLSLLESISNSLLR